MKIFTTKPEFFRYINNANEELTIRYNKVYNSNNELIAEYDFNINTSASGTTSNA